tara:strand:- start:360 stop:611 length:252 start_codon:yes stop_codon:yes gene_type:complete
MIDTNKTIINLKFRRRTTTGEYTTIYEGYHVRIYKEYETGKWYLKNWSFIIKNLNTGALEEYAETANSYRDAKEKVKDILMSI